MPEIRSSHCRLFTQFVKGFGMPTTTVTELAPFGLAKRKGSIHQNSEYYFSPDVLRIGFILINSISGRLMVWKDLTECVGCSINMKHLWLAILAGVYDANRELLTFDVFRTRILIGFFMFTDFLLVLRSHNFIARMFFSGTKILPLFSSALVDFIGRFAVGSEIPSISNILRRLHFAWYFSWCANFFSYCVFT